jgi:hypothetical protein
MQSPVFPAETLNALAVAYPAMPIKVRHNLRGHPLLTLPALADLAEALPTHEIEYNPGKLPIGIKPEDVPKSELTVTETIRTIGRAGSWVALKRVEQVPAYRVLVEAIVDELRPIVEPRTGAMMQLEGFIFISSPGAVTPLHFDPEHNILLQLTGSKTMSLFPVEDEIIFNAKVHEQFHLGQHHRNLPWESSFVHKATAELIDPGEAVHVPVKAPHWVLNGGMPSISLSVTWRSDWSYAEADARAFNHVLRKFGLRPTSPGAFPARNTGKAMAWRAMRRLRGAA